MTTFAPWGEHRRARIVEAMPSTSTRRLAACLIALVLTAGAAPAMADPLAPPTSSPNQTHV